MNRVIITGGNGFIGRHLARKILSCDLDSALLISNTSNVNDEILLSRAHMHDTSLKFYTADIRNKESICDIFRSERADTCIHLAAKTSVYESIKNSTETMAINVKGTANVLEACHRSSVKNFVLASSAAVYGHSKDLPNREDHKLEPLSPYGTSKMLAEEHVSSFGRLKKIQNTVILRIFNPYGHGHANDLDVITKFAVRLKKGLPPIIYDNGNQTRDFISIDDIIEGIMLSIDLMDKSDNENRNNILDSEPIFNIGTGKPTRIKDIASKMIATSGLDLQPIFEKPSENRRDVMHSYADITKSERLLGFAAKKKIETGIEDIVKRLLIDR